MGLDVRAGLATRPVDVGELFLCFGRDAKCDSSVERYGVKLDVEAFAIALGPSRADSREEALFALFAPHLVGDESGRFGSGCLRFVGIAHDDSPSIQVCDRDHRGLTARETKPISVRRASKPGIVENWGRPSGGTYFPLARPGVGFSVPVE